VNCDVYTVFVTHRICIQYDAVVRSTNLQHSLVSLRSTLKQKPITPKIYNSIFRFKFFQDTETWSSIVAMSLVFFLFFHNESVPVSTNVSWVVSIPRERELIPATISLRSVNCHSCVVFSADINYLLPLTYSLLHTCLHVRVMLFCGIFLILSYLLG